MTGKHKTGAHEGRPYGIRVGEECVTQRRDSSALLRCARNDVWVGNGGEGRFANRPYGEGKVGLGGLLRRRDSSAPLRCARNDIWVGEWLRLGGHGEVCLDGRRLFAGRAEIGAGMMGRVWGRGAGGFETRPYGEGKVRGAGDCYDDKIPRGTRNDIWGNWLRLE